MSADDYLARIIAAEIAAFECGFSLDNLKGVKGKDRWVAYFKGRDGRYRSFYAPTITFAIEGLIARLNEEAGR